MGRNPEHNILFEPVPIGPKVLRNRFYQTPHCSGFGTEKPWSQASLRGVKAEGGWAAVCTEFVSISEDGDNSPAGTGRLWDDEDARSLGLMSDAAHEHGALAGIELYHGGMMSPTGESRLPSLAPSQVASGLMPPRGSAPKAMDRDDIEHMQEDWVRAAVRARDAGFDIVYVYGAHSFLFSQFLSPALNRRTDEYGGSLENRARMWLETLARVRTAVGDDCAIVARFAVDALGPYGVRVEEGLEFVSLADDLVDLWDVTVGSVAGVGRVDSGASRFFEEGHQLEWTARVGTVTEKPIVGVGRFTNPDTMAAAVRRGDLDVIGAARPTIADPFLPIKVSEGRYDEIRACIGCNVCFSRANFGHHLGCTQNATSGEEFRRGWHPERFAPAANADQDVLIVGGGPAGLECAIVLGKRGFKRIQLIEAEREIGGTARWIPTLPGLAEWGRVVEWRSGQLKRLPAVEVITDTRWSTEQVINSGAQLVIFATGSHWSTDGLNGFSVVGSLPGADAAQPWVLTPDQIMVAGKRPPGRRVVVFDTDGYYMAASIAELLATENQEVVVVTPYETVAPVCNETLEGPLLRQRLHDLGVRMHTSTVLTGVDPDHAQLKASVGTETELAMDAVVLVTQRVSDSALYDDVATQPRETLDAAGIEAVYRVGDCVAPRLMSDAIWDGHRLAREIDAPHPGRPLPFKRERPLVTVSVGS